MGMFTCTACAGTGRWFSGALSSPASRPLFLVELADGSFAYKVRGQIRDTDKLVFDGPSAHQQDGLPEPAPQALHTPQGLDWGDEVDL